MRDLPSVGLDEASSLEEGVGGRGAGESSRREFALVSRQKKVASERDSLCLRKRVGRRERPQERKS